ncbi:MAG: redoxin domain-containing protein [Chthonomonas sp.]|nr:redoxin domain-containing protein [Chthonomonas sp.]
MARRPWLAAIFPLTLLAGCQAPPPPIHPSLDPANAKIDPSKIHPVTREMSAEAEAMSAKKLPEFRLRSTDGTVVTNADLVKIPTVLYFVNLECPCCVDSNPLFRDLAKAGMPIRVIGVADGPLDKAKKWVKANETGYPVLADPLQTLMRALKIRNGVYFAVISPNGSISKIEPGVSADVMAQTVARLGEIGEFSAPRLNWDKAPERLTSGCAFSWTE